MLAGKPEGARPEAGHVKRYGVLEVDEAVIRHEMPDRARRVAEPHLRLIASQEGSQFAEVAVEGGDGLGFAPHHPHRCVPRADAKKGASRRECVDGCDGRGGHWRWSRAGDGDARPEANALGSIGGKREACVAVRPEHLTVGEPQAGEPERFRARRVVEIADVGSDADADVH